MEKTIKGLKINYKTVGEGKPLLILHGWGSKSDRWLRVGELLKDFKVIIPDLPGFGNSQTPPVVWNLDDYCDFVEAFAADLDEFYLLGHSFGGAIAAKLALRRTLKIEKIFLVASACIRRKTIKKQVLSRVSKSLKVFSFLPFYSLARKAFYKFIVGGSDYPYAQGVMKETYLKIIDEDLSKSLHLITVPTVIIWGDKDDTTLIEDGYYINKEIKGSELIVIPGAGHDIEIKQPEALARNIV